MNENERQAHCRQIVERLVSAYRDGGAEALAKMTVVEMYVLYAELLADLDSSKPPGQHRHDAAGPLRMAMLEQEVDDIESFMKEHVRDFEQIKRDSKEKGPERER